MPARNPLIENKFRLKTIAESRTYQQALAHYNTVLEQFDASGKLEYTDKARYDAIEASFNLATDALTAAIDAHCADCITEALAPPRQLVFPRLKRPAKEESILQHALSGLVDASIALHQAGGLTTPTGAPFDVALSAVWDTINAAVEAYTLREIAEALSGSTKEELSNETDQ